MLCGAFVGCSKDDDGENSKDNYEDLIVGTWNLCKDWEEGEYYYYEEGEYAMCFQSGGRGYEIIDEEKGYNFNWDIEGSWLHIEDGKDEYMIKIQKLTKNELVLSWEYEEWIEYYERAK